MATAGKSSLKRGKPNYIYSIVGVALVLFMMGIMGWFFLNSKEIATKLKEDIKISVYLRTLNKDTIGQIQQFIATQPFSKDVRYINKAEATKIWNAENNDEWAQILDVNPLPESIDFFARAAYVNKDSLEVIANSINRAFSNQVTDISYPKDLTSNLDQKAKEIGLIFLVISIVLCLIVIFSIDNTIRLAMFSNRFLIKTMQMVGATRGFIAKPMNIKAIVNGLISGLIAVLLLFILIGWAESQIVGLREIRDTKLTLTLFGGMVLLGVLISFYSTHRSVLKYLKMKLDDLY
ncbi:MAG: permease-like cell division protein FtsX [Chitinophagaceae bacterium]|jgi:cell division transport system permease protein|nr:permease-like cell division protein FtsX [Chitinophagaceae bacterium]